MTGRLDPGALRAIDDRGHIDVELNRDSHRAPEIAAATPAHLRVVQGEGG